MLLKVECGILTLKQTQGKGLVILTPNASKIANSTCTSKIR